MGIWGKRCRGSEAKRLARGFTRRDLKPKRLARGFTRQRCAGVDGKRVGEIGQARLASVERQTHRFSAVLNGQSEHRQARPSPGVPYGVSERQRHAGINRRVTAQSEHRQARIIPCAPGGGVSASASLRRRYYICDAGIFRRAPCLGAALLPDHPAMPPTRAPPLLRKGVWGRLRPQAFKRGASSCAGGAAPRLPPRAPPTKNRGGLATWRPGIRALL